MVQVLPETILCAANLAHRGLLGPVEVLNLHDVELSSVPTERLSSLVSSVTRIIAIDNVSGCNLLNIIDSLNKISICYLENQILGSEETEALVRVMESCVDSVRLDEVTLDIEALVKYSGRGKCKIVTCVGDTAKRYREILRSWAQSRNWAVEVQHLPKQKQVFKVGYSLWDTLIMG